MNKHRVLSMVAAMMAAVTLAMPLPASAAAESDVTADTDNIYFSSAIPSAPNGSAIINCLGYLVTMKDAGGNSIGTIFVHGDSLTGRSYYTGYDRNTGKLMTTGNGKYQTEIRIPITDILSEYSVEHGSDASAKAKSIFAKKISGSCSISTIMCTAKLEGNYVAVQDGWNQELKVPGAQYARIAYTQVKLKQKAITAENILKDLSILNANSTYAAAKNQNDNLQCFEVNPNIDLTNGGAVISATNGTDNLAKQYSNLRSDSTFKSFQSSTKSMIVYSYYNVKVTLTGVNKKRAQYKPGTIGTVDYTVKDESSSAAPVKNNVKYGDLNIGRIVVAAVIGFAILAGLGAFTYFIGKSGGSEKPKE